MNSKLRSSLVFSAALAAAVMLAASPASAQPEEPELEPEPEPEPEAQPAEPQANNQPASSVGGGTDHDQTIGAWGIQVTSGMEFTIPGPLMPTVVSLPVIGVRRWNSSGTGWEAGALLSIDRDGAADATDMMFGGSFGFLKTLGVYEHMVVFGEPQAVAVVVVPDGGDTGFLVDARLNVGVEVRLGFLGLPRLGMTAKIAAGVTLLNDGNDTSVFFGTMGSENGSIEGLLDGTVGFVFYM